MVISLEAAGRQGKLHHGMLIGADHVVAHETWPGVPEAEYSCVEPKTLVWKLSDMVNLQRSQHSPAGPDTLPSVVETTIGTVEAGLAVLEGEGIVRSAHDERAAIRQALATGGDLGEQASALVADLISELRSSWRLTSAWQTRHEGRDAAETRGFAVWDCGPLGYWLRELPAEPCPRSGSPRRALSGSSAWRPGRSGRGSPTSCPTRANCGTQRRLGRAGAERTPTSRR